MEPTQSPGWLAAGWRRALGLSLQLLRDDATQSQARHSRAANSTGDFAPGGWGLRGGPQCSWEVQVGEKGSPKG